ncbi:MAG: DUF3429 domain-containing protein [Alphaproteobacteria bacterium]|nr:DUF3429 domain-containing protein [Alphaproteobacteria bacterium]
MAFNRKRLIHLLTYSGGIPFIIYAISSIFDYPKNYEQIISNSIDIYSLLIISFISGSHWGLSLNNDKKVNVLILSNVIVLGIWFAYIFQFYFKSVFLTAFTILLWIDYSYLLIEKMNRWYFELRRNISLIVLLSLILGIIF